MTTVKPIVSKQQKRKIICKVQLMATIGRGQMRQEKRPEVEIKGLKLKKRTAEEKMQYIFNLADVIRLCVCQERRIS